MRSMYLQYTDFPISFPTLCTGLLMYIFSHYRFPMLCTGLLMYKFFYYSFPTLCTELLMYKFSHYSFPTLCTGLLMYHFSYYRFPTLCTGLLIIVGRHHMHEEIDPSFHYGVDQVSIINIYNITILCITMVVIIWYLDLRLQSIPITTNILLSPLMFSYHH